MLLSGFLSLCPMLPGCSFDAPATFENRQQEIVWMTKLPGEAGIFNDGLIGLPVYERMIIFHSTYTSSSMKEDNRLHALDKETGELIWTYPQEYNQSEPHFFWGTPYLFNEYMVTKMPAFGNLSDSDYLLCLNLKDGTKKWNLKLPADHSRFTSRKVAGSGNKVYFVQQSKQHGFVYQADITTGSAELLHTVYPSVGFSKAEITSHDIALLELPNDTLLVLGVKETNARDPDDKGRRSVYVLRLSPENATNLIPVPGDSLYSIGGLKAENELVYISCGRTVFCVDVLSGQIVWSYVENTSLNEVAPSLELSPTVIFLWGHQRCFMLNRETGKLLFEFQVEAGNVTVDEATAYVVGRDGKLYLFNLQTGALRMRLPVELPNSMKTPFSTGCKPRISEGRIYGFGYQHALCFQLEHDVEVKK